MASETINFTINLNGNAYTGVAQIDKALGGMVASSKKVESIFDKMTQTSFKLNTIYQASQTLIGKVSSALGKVFDVGSETELQKLNMVTLFRGNEAAADDMFKKIAQYGKVTVYDKAGLIDAQKTMMSFGISGEQSFKTLKQIGDIAMGDANKMQSLALAFAQATSAGKLQGQDLMQLINAGFNPLQTISEHTGKSMATLKDEMSKGKISAEMLAQAFTWATAEGSLFYQGTEKAGASSSGKLNQLKDIANEKLVNTFNRLKPLIDACIDFATRFLEVLPAIFSNIATAVSAVIGVIEDFAPIIIGAALAIGVLVVSSNALRISLMLQNMWLNILIAKEKVVTFATNLWSGAQKVLNAVMSANPIGLIIAAIAVLVGAIVWVCTKVTGWGSLWSGICGFMKWTFAAFVDAAKLQFLVMINAIMIGLDKIKLGWYKFKEATGLGDSSENQKMISQINADVEARKKAIVDGMNKVKDDGKKAMAALKGIDMSWKKDGGKKTARSNSATVNEQLIDLANGGTGKGTSKGTGMGVTKNTDAVATGGSRSTNISISLKDLVGTINFSGTLASNKEEMERALAESMLRVLNMAQTSVG